MSSKGNAATARSRQMLTQRLLPSFAPPQFSAAAAANFAHSGKVQDEHLLPHWRSRRCHRRPELFRTELKRRTKNTMDAPDDNAREPLLTVCFDVVRHRGTWRVLHIGRYSDPHANQASAIESALEQARGREAAGDRAVVRLNRTDGTVVILTEDRRSAYKEQASREEQSSAMTSELLRH